MNRFISRSILALAVAVAASSASASQTLEVNFELTAGCDINPIAPINLGTASINVGDQQGTTLIEVRCPNGLPYTVKVGGPTDTNFFNSNVPGLGAAHLLRQRIGPGIYDTAAGKGIPFSFDLRPNGSPAWLGFNQDAVELTRTGDGGFQAFDVRARFTQSEFDASGYTAPVGQYQARVTTTVTF